MPFPHVVWGSEFESVKTSTTKRLPLGTQMVAEDGRCFRYCENGGAAQVVGKLYQSEVPLADGLNEVVGTIAAGQTVLTAVGATTGNYNIDILVDGYCYSLTAASLGPCNRIKSNTLITAGAATGTITLYEPLDVALGAADTISYTKNPYMDVIIHPSPPTAMVCGVAVKAHAQDVFGFLATKGPCRVLVDGTHIAGDIVVPSTAVDGAWMPSAAFHTDGSASVRVITVEADTTYGLVWLDID